MRTNVSPGEATLKPRIIVAGLLALALSAGAAVAQPAKSLKDEIVGTWNFVVAEVVAPDGKKSFPFGEARKPADERTPCASGPTGCRARLPQARSARHSRAAAPAPARPTSRRARGKVSDGAIYTSKVRYRSAHNALFSTLYRHQGGLATSGCRDFTGRLAKCNHHVEEGSE
jgi:hypothetical protein